MKYIAVCTIAFAILFVLVLSVGLLFKSKTCPWCGRKLHYVGKGYWCFRCKCYFSRGMV